MINSLCFAEYSNSVVEGAHNGIKHNSAPLVPSHTLQHAVAILSKNASRKEDARKKHIALCKHGSRTYNKGLELNNVLDYAYVRIQECIQESMKYINIKISKNTFLVTRNTSAFPYAGRLMGRKNLVTQHSL